MGLSMMRKVALGLQEKARSKAKKEEILDRLILISSEFGRSVISKLN
jgi:hypothetical protein